MEIAPAPQTVPSWPQNVPWPRACRGTRRPRTYVAHVRDVRDHAVRSSQTWPTGGPVHFGDVTVLPFDVWAYLLQRF